MAAEEIIHQQQKRKLRSLAHALKPIVTIGGSGLTPSVLNEIELSLNHHELLKIKLSCGDKAARKKVREEICSETNGHLIQEIGGVIVIYRKTKVTVKKAKAKKNTPSKRQPGKARTAESRPSRRR
ncbi:MAG: YhbY family RNA-binding protein [Thiotrichaceae bacterium]|nr:YhbY family RNA-binding protein [Thiotrichaceae bacterium]